MLAGEVNYAFEKSDSAQAKKAALDIKNAFLQSDIWMALAWRSLKIQYRRTVLGPFWITASTAIFLASIGPLYSKILGVRSADYLHYFIISYVLW